MDKGFDGVAEDEVVIQHAQKADNDDDGSGIGEFFTHKLVLMWIPAFAGMTHGNLFQALDPRGMDV